MIAYATLGRPAGDVVLDTIALKDLHIAAIHLHRDRNDQLPLRAAQNVPRRVVEFQIIGGAIKLLFRDLKWI